MENEGLAYLYDNSLPYMYQYEDKSPALNTRKGLYDTRKIIGLLHRDIRDLLVLIRTTSDATERAGLKKQLYDRAARIVYKIVRVSVEFPVEKADAFNVKMMSMGAGALYADFSGINKLRDRMHPDFGRIIVGDIPVEEFLEEFPVSIRDFHIMYDNIEELSHWLSGGIATPKRSQLAQIVHTTNIQECMTRDEIKPIPLDQLFASLTVKGLRPF